MIHAAQSQHRLEPQGWRAELRLAGASINIEAEVDSATLEEPARLKERIRQLFALVRTSLDEELCRAQTGHPAGNKTLSTATRAGRAHGQRLAQWPSEASHPFPGQGSIRHHEESATRSKYNPPGTVPYRSG